MLRLFLMLLVLCSTAQAVAQEREASSQPPSARQEDRSPTPHAPAQRAEVYFNNDIGIVFEENQADIRFGMTLDEVRAAMKQTAKLTSGKERSLIFNFACKSDDCTIEDGGVVAFGFVNNVLVGIMLSANDDITAEKYSSLPLEFYGRKCDYRCKRVESGGEMNSFGWKGKIKTTVTMINAGGGKGLVLTEFRTDKFRFNVRKSVCAPGS